MKGADQCPTCGKEAGLEFRKIGDPLVRYICANRECATVWEPFDPADLLDDEPTSSFKTPCDNCAFRKDSPERQDEEQWALKMESFTTFPPTVFLCHKGVPVSKEDGEAHDYPKKENGEVDLGQSRYCRGWLNLQRGIEDRAMKTVRAIREGRST